jgi:hypothetical protein
MNTGSEKLKKEGHQSVHGRGENRLGPRYWSRI